MHSGRGPHGEVVIRIEGTFDQAAARRLAGRLGEIPVEHPLVLEFGGRDCLDLGLAAVAGDLARRPALVVRGISHHQRKLLRYLGVRPEGLATRLAG